MWFLSASMRQHSYRPEVRSGGRRAPAAMLPTQSMASLSLFHNRNLSSFFLHHSLYTSKSSQPRSPYTLFNLSKSLNHRSEPTSMCSPSSTHAKSPAPAAQGETQHGSSNRNNNKAIASKQTPSMTSPEEPPAQAIHASATTPTQTNSPALPIHNETEQSNNNATLNAFSQFPSTSSPRNPTPHPSSGASTTPSSPQPFVPASGHGNYLHLSRPCGPLNTANLRPSEAGMLAHVGEYRGVRFSTNIPRGMPSPPPPHYEAPANENTPPINRQRLPAPSFNYPRTIIRVLRPDGMVNGQFGMQFANAQLEAESLAHVRPWLEGGANLFPPNFRWEAVTGDGRIVFMGRARDAAVARLLR